ncbi:MAG: Holliday junction branch migration protein RuvA [Pseudomonadota bacterium]
MIGKLTGIVDTVSRDGILLDVNGVGYLVFASALTQRGLSTGDRAVLWIETHVREDHIHLFGFASLAERDWFRLLTGVQGVGGRVGLAILSVLEPDDIALAIAAQDKRAFAKADGVGPRLATRIVSELRDKAPAAALGPSGTAEASSSSMEEAVSALVNLGFDRSAAMAAVGKVRGGLPAEKADQLDAVLPGALKELAG